MGQQAAILKFDDLHSQLREVPSGESIDFSHDGLIVRHSASVAHVAIVRGVGGHAFVTCRIGRAAESFFEVPP